MALLICFHGLHCSIDYGLMINPKGPLVRHLLYGFSLCPMYQLISLVLREVYLTAYNLVHSGGVCSTQWTPNYTTETNEIIQSVMLSLLSIEKKLRICWVASFLIRFKLVLYLHKWICRKSLVTGHGGQFFDSSTWCSAALHLIYHHQSS